MLRHTADNSCLGSDQRGWAPRTRRHQSIIDSEMAIVRAQSQVFESIKGVHFLMRDANTRKTLACLITREALTERGSIHEPPLDPMQVFTAYRDEIERVADDCWERGEVDDGGIIRLTGAQFPKRPAEKPSR